MRAKPPLFRFVLGGAGIIGVPNTLFGLYQAIFIDPHSDSRLGLAGALVWGGISAVAGALAGVLGWAILILINRRKECNPVLHVTESESSGSWPPAPKSRE